MGHATVTPTPSFSVADLARVEFLARYTGNTRAGYDRDLRMWFDYCAAIGVEVLDVKRPHIEAFGHHMASDLHHKVGSVARRLSTVCGFYGLAAADDYIQVDPARYVRRPKVPAESPTLGLSYLEFARFNEAAELEGPTAHCTAMLLGMLGLRASEAAAVRVEHLGEERGHVVLRVVGKGGKRALIPLPVPVARVVAEVRAGRADGPLLRTRTGSGFTRSAVTRMVERIARRAGITKRISPHSLRHTYVTQLLDAGASLRDVQIGARHADPRMTMRYDRARQQLDRHVNYVLAARMAGA